MIASELNIPIEKIQRILAVFQNPTSLDLYIGEDKDTPICNLIIDDRPQPAALAEKYDLTRHIYQVFQSLSRKERQVLIHRFGLFTHERYGDKTLQEVGDILGVTRERVRQIQDKSIKKLKYQLCRNDFMN